MNEGTSALKQEAQLTVLDAPTPAKDMAVLYKKLANVINQVGRVAKNGTLKTTSFEYKFASESDIKDVIRPLLAEQNIALLANMIAQREETLIDKDYKGNDRISRVTYVTIRFTLACGDTGATISETWDGKAQDNQDKGINKAATAALKYFLINNFLISTGEDPDGHSGEGDTAPAAKSNGKAAPAPNTQGKVSKSPETAQNAKSGASSSVFGKAKDPEEAVAGAFKFQQDKKEHPHWLIDGEFIAKCKGYWPKVTDGQIDMAVMAVQDPDKVENKVLMAAAVFASAMNGDKDAILAYAATQENREFWDELAQTAIEVAPRVVNF